MRIYASRCKNFIVECQQNQIGERLKTGFELAFGSRPSPSEEQSWKNSLRLLGFALSGANLEDAGILLEYRLPFSSKRVDCILCGYDESGCLWAVVIELKQWSMTKEADGPLEVLSFVGGGEREHLHPSEQARRYAEYLENSHSAFQGAGGGVVKVAACAYLHNYATVPNDPLTHVKFQSLLEAAPLFCADDVNEFAAFLKKHVGFGDGLPVLSLVEQESYKPSKKLMEHVSAVIGGDPEFVLLDEQQIAFDTVLTALSKGVHNRKKQVVIVKGGPGTGKSVLAINLLAALLSKHYASHYVTGSKAFTETLRKIIGPLGSALFTYSNNYMQAMHDSVDVLVVDEAHRIRDVSSNRFTPASKRSGIKQVEELIRACRVAVFLIDDDQIVRPGEIGSATYLRQYAELAGAEVREYSLDAQFRCAGSENYLHWLSSVLGMGGDPALELSDSAFEFKIFDSPDGLSRAIRKKVEEGNSGRLMAGFCWPWSDPTSDGQLVHDVSIGKFKSPWNAKPDAGRLAKGIPKASHWAHQPEGLEQVGCVYTAQGFEFDYAGVIVGADLRWDVLSNKWIGDKTKSFDGTVKRSGEDLAQYLKNTYRVLLSRGMKGCYVYFIDKETEQYVSSRLHRAVPIDAAVPGNAAM